MKNSKSGSVLLLGTGSSSLLLGNQTPNWVDTCGVNDFTGKFWPTNYSVCADKLRVFNDERALMVYNTKSKYVFTHLINNSDLKFKTAEKVIFEVNDFRGQVNLNIDRLDVSYTSTFLAVQVLFHLGYKKIGILGSDLLPDSHHLCRKRNEMIRHWSQMYVKMFKEGTELICLSQEKDTVLQPLTQMSIEEFKLLC